MTMVSTLAPASVEALDLAECRVCRLGSTNYLMQVDGRRYERCSRCQCTLVARDDLPTVEQEEAQYRLHRNEISDPSYRAFVAKVVDPLLDLLRPGSDGLDYGCGPGPVGAEMLRERGHDVMEYDPIFSPNPVALAYDYDFILCSEVVEHFHEPAREFDKLAKLLKPGGWLAIMTGFQSDDRLFAQWHYRRDPTHVAFYREATLRQIAQDRNWDIMIPHENVALLNYPDVQSISREVN